MPPLTNRDTPPVHCNAALLQALDLLYVTPDTWHFFYCAFERSVGTFVQRSVRTAFSSYSVQFVHSFSVQFVQRSVRTFVQRSVRTLRITISIEIRNVRKSGKS